MSFENMGLIDALLKAVQEVGYKTPTEIQTATIDAVLQGRDLMASAQTGTGKTAAFTLPLLQKLSSREPGGKKKTPRALVVTPTRELAAQIQASIQTYGKYLKLSSHVVFGGVKIGPQINRLRQGVDVLVATPGRLLDLHNQGAVDLQRIEILVLDEADRMLDMGFIHDIRRIQRLMPDTKQSLLFSATFSKDIRELARGMLDHPIEVSVAAENTTAETVKHKLVPVDKKSKTALLSHLANEQGWHQALVFTRTKHGANKLVKELGKAGLHAAAIHGNKSQAQRTLSLERFKNGKVGILVATDIASRGLDINQLPLVVNFDLPNVPEDYVHRIGRTGRAGKSGKALSLVSADEFKQLQDIEKVIEQEIPREEVEGFEAEHALPASRTRGRHKPVSRGRKPSDSGGNKQRRNKRRSPRKRAA
jgi:ATP-dependent RNA helicase RhlE